MSLPVINTSDFSEDQKQQIKELANARLKNMSTGKYLCLWFDTVYGLSPLCYLFNRPKYEQYKKIQEELRKCYVHV